jgi:hypothetical protein
MCKEVGIVFVNHTNIKVWICMQDGSARPVREVLKSYCTRIRVFTIVVEPNLRLILWSEDKFGNRYFTFKVRVWVSEPYIGCPYPCPRVLGGHGCDIIVHWWAWVGIVFVYPCIQLQIGVKLLGCKEYANQETLWNEANDSERPFICPIQPRLGVGG